MWGRPLDVEKKSVEAPPIVVTEAPKEPKAVVFAELQAIMTAVKEKPKTVAHPASPQHPRNVAVDEWGEVIHNID
jgi:hypothetical protein